MPGFINEYKIDIQQGNVLTQEMVAQLKPGRRGSGALRPRFADALPIFFMPAALGLCFAIAAGRPGKTEARKLSVFFDAENRLERVAAMSRCRDGRRTRRWPKPPGRSGLAFGEDADKPLPPREEPGWFRRFMMEYVWILGNERNAYWYCWCRGRMGRMLIEGTLRAKIG